MCCWSAARSPIAGAPSDGIRCGCSPRTGRAGCRASAMTATTPTATGRCLRSIDFIGNYAKAISAPVRTHTTVTSVRSDGAGYLVRTDRGDWRCRTVVLASGACNIARLPDFADRVPRVGRHADGAVLPQSGSGRRRRRDGGGRVVERHPDRAGAAAFGASGDPVGRRAHSGAPHLSRQGPGMVDGRRRRARRALRRGRRHHAGAAGSFAAACRHARPHHPRPQCADRPRRQARRPSRRHHRRRQGAVCRVAAQHVRAFRSQDGPAARPHRRMGARQRPRRHGRAAASPAADPCRGQPAARPRPRRRRDQDDHLGHRLPAGLFLAGAAGPRPQGPCPSRRRGCRTSRACT